jgi:hypothetical protein
MAKIHPSRGRAVLVQDGPFKGQYFKVINFLTEQFQGKQIEKLAVSKASLVTPVVGRGYPLDDEIVFGQIYPTMQYICVHDKEISLPKPKLAAVPPLTPEELAAPAEAEVIPLKGEQDATTRSNKGNSKPTKPGRPKSK